MMVAVWVVVGVVLLAIELHHLALYALFVALGAFGAAIVAAVAPDAIALQVVVAVLVAVVGILAVRPVVRRRLEQRQGPPPGRGVHGTLVGEIVTTLDVVGDGQHPGHVRLAGERWLAVSGSGRTVESGSAVVVTEVRGTTLVVWPVHAELADLPPLPDLARPDLVRPEAPRPAAPDTEGDLP